VQAQRACRSKNAKLGGIFKWAGAAVAITCRDGQHEVSSVLLGWATGAMPACPTYFVCGCVMVGTTRFAPLRL